MKIFDDGRLLVGGVLVGLVASSGLRRGSSASEGSWLRELDSDEYSEEPYWRPGAYGPSRKIFIRGRQTLLELKEGREHVLSSGSRDDVTLFVPKDEPLSTADLYVVSENSRYGTIGVEAFRPEDEESEEWSWFAQSDEQAADALGSNWRRLRPKTVVSRIANNYFY